MIRFDYITGPEAESPLAVRLERVLDLHISEETTLIREFPCPTPWATFRIDLVAQTPTTRIGFECDGKDFHDPHRDEIRDSLILGQKCVDTIYRLPGDQVNFAVHDLLFLVSLYDPSLFTERGRKVLETQACDSVKTHEPDGYGGMILGGRYDRGDPPRPLVPPRYSMKRSSVTIPSGMKPFWTDVYRHAVSHQNLSFADYYALRLAEMKLDWDFASQ